jgi:hypothetical protein
MLSDLLNVAHLYIPSIRVSSDVIIPEVICGRSYIRTYMFICTYATTHVMIILANDRGRRCFVSQPTIEDLIKLSTMDIPIKYRRACNIGQLCLIIAISLFTKIKDFRQIHRMIDYHKLYC